ncbi:unnamed protein product [Bursaphelenchus okinawaensis]|uniref:Acyl_transf_3 domain-containing protein n=1 Tax=Bursaphelenchus okinawaensis TaxID=465554 RepID=A0A811KPC4_9BILA|nr:unnamed protein product [Bursaphelenchus okinawaensis]CAG9109940.1 unnamed protein product [Bursaphelenchus okinawaensis]
MSAGAHAPKRLDLQGLRCIAIVAVLLFHIWPKLFPNGYLGVDMFFVLSGYLMYTILSAKPLNTVTITDFYYRRIKRIIPTYLFVIIMSLTIGFIVFTSREYGYLVKESLTAATLTSNMLNLPEHGYFKINNEFTLFLHTWSLSVEFQFYLICPILFGTLSCLSDKNRFNGILFWLVVSVTSFAFQWYYTYEPNISHMSLPARIWQFFFGFAVGMARAMQNDNVYVSLDGKQTQPACNTYYIKSAITLFVLLPILLMPDYIDAVVLRFLATLVTAIVIYDNGDSICSNSYVVWIGDISYSVYLAHWPIIKFVQYNIEDRESGLSLFQGILIIVASVQLGNSVESFFAKISQSITSWLRLLLVLMLLYCTLFSTQIYVTQKVPSTEVDGARVVDWKDPSYLSFIEKMYKKRGQDLELSLDELLTFNEGMVHYVETYFRNCKNNSAKRYPEMKFYEDFFYGCSIDGKGDKEVVVIGNSMARDIFTGFQQLWKGTYKRLTMAAHPTEVPFSIEDAEVGNKYINLLKEWDRPIDIVIVQHAYFEIPLEYRSGKMKEDIDNFYKDLQPLVKDVIMIGAPEVWQETSKQKMLKIIENKEDYDKVSIGWDLHIAINAKMRIMIENLPCEKCVIVDFVRSICSRVTAKCHGILPNGIMVFRDRIHTTLVINLMAKQGQGKARARPGQGQGKARARPGQGQGKARARPGQGQGKARARPGQGQGKARARPGQGQGKARARPGQGQGKARARQVSLFCFASSIVKTFEVWFMLVMTAVTHAPKRLDLQGLRCIAIVAVLLFHIWPKLFPNGYLGVDMFFVLSGYLMYTILSAKPMNKVTIADFYYRRIKRIIPSYLFVIIATLVIGFVVFTSREYGYLVKESLTAATLTSNMFNLPEHGYFKINNEFTLFLHTWSLSVEIQFYLICPLLFGTLKYLNSRNKAFGGVYWLIITLISFGFQWLYRNNPNISHMSLPARIWQFFFGFAVGMVRSMQSHTSYVPLDGKEPVSLKTYYIKSAITLLILIPILVMPDIVDAVLLRLLATLVTAVVIYGNGESICSHPYLVWIGDISYSVYLVHWPIIKCVEYNMENKDNGLSLLRKFLRKG